MGQGTRDKGQEIAFSCKPLIYQNGFSDKKPFTRPRTFSSISSAFCLFLIILLFMGCSQKLSSQSEFVLGTVCTITLFENGSEKVFREVFFKLREIDNLMSVNIPSSDISRINASAGIEPVQIHDESINLIQISLFSWAITEGAFNPAVGPIVSLWNINGNNPRVPSKQEINEALALSDLENNFDIDRDARSFFLKKTGMSLDLGAIAKGYAADCAAEIIINAGIKSAIIDLGGNIVVIGKNKNNRAWRVGIQNPDGNRGEYISVVEVDAEEGKTQMSIVTSGVYERFFEQDGKRYHHIFSPDTGYPVDNELLSVTIVAESSVTADALSTAVFVLGYEKGIKLLDTLSHDNFYDSKAVFIFKDGRIINHQSLL